MSNETTAVAPWESNESALAKYQKYDVATFSEIAGSSFPSRLQLMTAMSDKCKDGSFPMNHYALINGQNHDDLGKEVDLLPICWRPKAIDMNEGVLAFFNPETPEFKDVVERAAIRDSRCMYGPEYLVYIPSRKCFTHLFFGSATARNEAPLFSAQLGKPTTLDSKPIESKKNGKKWQGMNVRACSTPFDYPSEEDIARECERFNNPPKATVETVAEGEAPSTSRD